MPLVTKTSRTSMIYEENWTVWYIWKFHWDTKHWDIVIVNHDNSHIRKLFGMLTLKNYRLISDFLILHEIVNGRLLINSIMQCIPFKTEKLGSRNTDNFIFRLEEHRTSPFVGLSNELREVINIFNVSVLSIGYFFSLYPVFFLFPVNLNYSRGNTTCTIYLGNYYHFL